MLADPKGCAPLGTLVEVMVCATVSKFFHCIVLLTPITTVTVAGVKESDEFHAPSGILTWTIWVDWVVVPPAPSGAAM